MHFNDITVNRLEFKSKIFISITSEFSMIWEKKLLWSHFINSKLNMYNEFAIMLLLSHIAHRQIVYGNLLQISFDFNQIYRSIGIAKHVFHIFFFIFSHQKLITAKPNQYHTFFYPFAKQNRKRNLNAQAHIIQLDYIHLKIRIEKQDTKR